MHGFRTTMVQPIQKTLKPLGLFINPYGRCVTKSIIDHKQRTIAGYVDNINVSHVEEK